MSRIQGFLATGVTILLLAQSVGAGRAASGFSNGQAALLVVGQPDFTTATLATTANGLARPVGMAFDPSGDLWISDSLNNRVLEFVPPFLNGMSASLVIGQSSFTTGTSATTAAGFFAPFSLGFDLSGDLWVPDAVNSRVLEFVPPFLNGMSASLVIGQSGFSTRSYGTTANAISAPEGVVFDSSGDLWISDNGNSRALEFVPPFSNGMSASLVIGQPSFTTSTIATTATGLSNPARAAFDRTGNLWIPDSSNNRVTEYVPPFTTGMAASVVIGQASFTTSAVAVTATGLNSPANAAFDQSGNLWVTDYYSNRVLEFHGPQGPPIPPSAPQTLSATGGNSQILLTWGAPSSNGGASITNYEIYRGTSSGGLSHIAEVGNVLTFTDTNLVNGVTYYYQISAKNAIGEGPKSNQVSASPIAQTLPTITITSPPDGSALTSESVTVSGTSSGSTPIQKVEVSLDGTNWTTATGTTSWSATIPVQDGSNTIYARATDASGNTQTTTITVSVVGHVITQPPPPIPILPIAVVSAIAGGFAAAVFLTRRGRKTN